MTTKVLGNESFRKFENLSLRPRHLLAPIAAIGLAYALGLGNDTDIENRPKQSNISHVIVVRECTPYESDGVCFVSGKIEYDLSNECPAERLVIR